MPSTDSDRGIDRGDPAFDSQQRGDVVAAKNALAPMKFQVAYYEEGEVTIGDFTCMASQRVAVARQMFGIDLDNDRVARRSKPDNPAVNWPKAIGDPELCKELDRKR